MQHMQRSDIVLKNGTLATMRGSEPYGLLRKSSIAVSGGLIDWIGPEDELPSKFTNYESFDVGGDVVTPGLIDCHTHLVHGGDRAKEFELRLNGATYEEIAGAGGGIVSTVAATRGSCINDLVETALPRLDALIAEGVCTVEIKSGYGLDETTELNMLRAARELAKHRVVRIKTSFLGAHAIPAEYAGRRDAYLADVCIPTLRKAHDEGLVDAVDGFCEFIAFDAKQIETVFEEAARLGLPVKLHAEQLSNIGGTQLLARYKGLSADHIEYATEQDVAALAKAGSTAVLLPGAFYTLRETRKPPVQALRDHGVAIALATDCNPGSSPLASILLTMNMGCTLFRLTPEEAMAGTTKHAARALGLVDCGTIEVGARADLCVWSIKEPSELSYRIGFNPLRLRLFGGRR